MRPCAPSQEQSAPSVAPLSKVGALRAHVSDRAVTAKKIHARARSELDRSARVPHTQGVGNSADAEGNPMGTKATVTGQMAKVSFADGTKKEMFVPTGVSFEMERKGRPIGTWSHDLTEFGSIQHTIFYQKDGRLYWDGNGDADLEDAQISEAFDRVHADLEAGTRAVGGGQTLDKVTTIIRDAICDAIKLKKGRAERFPSLEACAAWVGVASFLGAAKVDWAQIHATAVEEAKPKGGTANLF